MKLIHILHLDNFVYMNGSYVRVKGFEKLLWSCSANQQIMTG